MTDRLTIALAEIDAANGRDPARIVFDGAEHPLAQIEGARAHAWALRLRADADDTLQIAARGHHLRRWEVARGSYPRTRDGYLAWRTRLYDFHAEAMAELMARAGYPAEAQARVSQLVHKQALKVDADAQTYEDAVSLAFLEVRLAPFLGTVSEEQATRALRRTWLKMSPAGRAAAGTVQLEPAAAEAVRRALAR